MHPDTCRQAVQAEKLLKTKLSLLIHHPLGILLPRLTTVTINTDWNWNIYIKYVEFLL